MSRARVAVLGAGHAGPAIARVALAAGYGVTLATSRAPDEIALLASVLVPGAEPSWAAEAVDGADLVVLAIPLHRFGALDPELLAGKVVIDVMNYWPPVDGFQELFADRRYGSSEIVQQRLDRSTVVKTLNHLGYHELESARRPAGSPDRRALGVAGDDVHAVVTVTELVDLVGFDAVRLDLRGGRLLQPGGPVFGAELRRPDFEAALARADPVPLPTPSLTPTGQDH